MWHHSGSAAPSYGTLGTMRLLPSWLSFVTDKIAECSISELVLMGLKHMVLLPPLKAERCIDLVKGDLAEAGNHRYSCKIRSNSYYLLSTFNCYSVTI